MDHPPFAPMPPPPQDYSYPAHDFPSHPQDHHGQMQQPQPFYDHPDSRADNTSNKKDKSKSPDPPVEIRYEGYVLEKAEPLLGEKLSWARVGKRALPFDSDKLVRMVKAHRKKSGMGPAADFTNLNSNQQGIITRLIAERKQEEKVSNADWILLDVQRIGTRHWTSIDVKQLQVILKRVPVKPGEKSAKTNPYQFGEIIDLSEPLASKKKKGDKPKQKVDEHFAPHEGPIGPMDVPYGQEYLHPQDQGPPPMHPGEFRGYDHGPSNVLPPLHPEPHQGFDRGYGPTHPPPQSYPVQPTGGYQVEPPGVYQGGPPGGYQGEPPGAYFPPAPHPQPVYPPEPQYPSARHGPQDHPFAPNPGLMAPGQFDNGFPNEWEGRPEQPRVTTREPENVQRRPSLKRRDSSAKRLSRIEGKIGHLEDKINDWRISSASSEEPYEVDNVFSSPPSGGSFTPPSTPPLSEPRGSLHRRKSSRGLREKDRRSREQPRYRSDEWADVEPAYPRHAGHARHSPSGRRSSRDLDRRYHEDSYHSRRPRLHHAHTVDDYPSGRTAEYRSLPAPRPQRRLTDAGEGYDYVDADFRDRLRRQREGRRRSGVDMVQEAFEAGRREQARYGRRRSFVGDSDRYYD